MGWKIALPFRGAGEAHEPEMTALIRSHTAEAADSH